MKRIMCLLFGSFLVLGLMTACRASNKQSDSPVLKGAIDGYQYEIVNDVVQIISYANADGETAVIPEMIAGKPVKALGEDAFYQCKNLRFVTLPQTLTTLKGCPFYRCYSLQQITIPKNVDSIEGNPFFRCSALENITVDPENSTFSDVEGVLFDKEQSVLIAYPEGNLRETYTVPMTVKKITIDSFGYHTHLKTLVIRSNVIDFPEGNMFVFPDDIILYIEPDSAAEKYAEKHGLQYEYL